MSDSKKTTLKGAGLAGMAAVLLVSAEMITPGMANTLCALGGTAAAVGAAWMFFAGAKLAK